MKKPENRDPTLYALPAGKGKAVLNNVPVEVPDSVIVQHMSKYFEQPFVHCEVYPFFPTIKTGCRYIIFDQAYGTVPTTVSFGDEMKGHLKLVIQPSTSVVPEIGKGEATLLGIHKHTPKGYILGTLAEYFENPDVLYQRTPDTEVIVEQRLITFDSRLKHVPVETIEFHNAEGRITDVKDSKRDRDARHTPFVVNDAVQRAKAHAALSQLAQQQGQAPPPDLDPNPVSPIFIHHSHGHQCGKPGSLPAGNYQLSPYEKKSQELILTSENVVPGPPNPHFPDFFEELGQAMHMWRKNQDDMKVWEGGYESGMEYVDSLMPEGGMCL